jgi:hypothetical protein
MRSNMRHLALVMIGLAGCTSPDERRAQRASVERTAVSAESVKAAVARSLPATGLWDEPHLVERLVSAGLAPQAVTGARGEEYWRVPVLSYHVGSATLYAYVYADSVARRRVTDGLDTLTLAPKGLASPYPLPRIPIFNNNLAAVLVGGSERQQERVSNALLAGLPVTGKR